MARAENTICSSRCNTGIIGGSTVAGRSSPAGVADALATFTSAVIRAKLALVTVAREIVTLAEMSRYYLQEYESVKTFVAQINLVLQNVI